MTNQQPPDIIEIGGVKYQRLPEPKPQTLYDALSKKRGNYPMGMPEDVICEIVERWLPLEGCHELKSYDYSAGWNDCLQHLKEKLK
jgi:hypothetical protein